MLKNISESIKSAVQLITSLLTLAILMAVVGGGWWIYSKVTSFVANPPVIALPAVKLPEVRVQMPKIDVGKAMETAVNSVIPNISGIEKQMRFDHAFDPVGEKLDKLMAAGAEEIRKTEELANTQVRIVYDWKRSCKHTPQCDDEATHGNKALADEQQRCTHTPKCPDGSTHVLRRLRDIANAKKQLKEYRDAVSDGEKKP